MTTTKIDREQPIELIGEEDCLLACHESTITFTVDYGSLPVTDIDWTAEGGYVVSLSNGDAVAEISWPTVQSGGGVFVEVSLADGQVISGGICVTTKAKPEGGFEILGQVSQYFCSETELVFQNQFEVPDGTQIVASVWDFGDGNTSNETNPTHTYYAEGTYQISLTVYDECGCSSMWRESVTITKPGIIIECATAVCQGAIETYTLEGPAYANGNVNCQNYQWTAVGGQVMNQGQEKQ